MKKSLLISCFIFVGHFSIAQISQVLEQTWHLRSIMIDNTFNYVPYEQAIEMNFDGENPNYTLSTNGIENILTANVGINNNMLNLSYIQVSSLPCNTPICDFENLYFNVFLSNQNLSDKTFTYFYMVYSNGRKSLRLTDANGNIARFTDQPIPSIYETLFQEWHLHSMDVDMGESIFISNYEPPISPTLTINPDLTFTGFGSCNNFSGKFDFTEEPNSGLRLIPKDFEVSTDTCEFHTDFENHYFEQFSTGWPLYFDIWIDPNSGNSYFSFEMYAGYFFNFATYPVLSTPELKKNTFDIYPNPVKNQLSLKSEFINPVITITNINGRLVKKLKELNSNQIDVSDLESGMYFLTIQSSQGILTKKFIKN